MPNAYKITQKDERCFSLDIIHPEGKHFTLEELGKHVGGYIEVVPTLDERLKDYMVFVDEDAKLKENPLVNQYMLSNFNMELVGTVLIIPRAGEGE